MDKKYKPLRHMYREFLQLVRRHAFPRGLRVKLLKMSGANVGRNVYVGMEFFVFDAGRTEMLTIEDDVGIAPFVIILIHSSPGQPVLEEYYPTSSKPVTIKKGAWIGARSTILGGVTIGEHAVVAAGSVVNRNVPPYTVVGGVPAMTIKKLKEKDFDETGT